MGRRNGGDARARAAGRRCGCWPSASRSGWPSAERTTCASRTRDWPSPCTPAASSRDCSRSSSGPLAALAAEHGLSVEPGRQVVELRAHGTDKGVALERIVEEVSARHVVFAGDDLGDLPAFDAVDRLRAAGLTGLLICSASDEQDVLVARSDLVLDGPDAVAGLAGRPRRCAGGRALTELPHTPWTRIRTVVNWLNLSTLLGLLVARIGGATRHRRGRGTLRVHRLPVRLPRRGSVHGRQRDHHQARPRLAVRSSGICSSTRTGTAPSTRSSSDR